MYVYGICSDYLNVVQYLRKIFSIFLRPLGISSARGKSRIYIEAESPAKCVSSNRAYFSANVPPAERKANQR